MRVCLHQVVAVERMRRILGGLRAAVVPLDEQASRGALLYREHSVNGIRLPAAPRNFASEYIIGEKVRISTYMYMDTFMWDIYIYTHTFINIQMCVIEYSYFECVHICFCVCK